MLNTLLLARVAVSLGYVLMEDLSRAVAQFYPSTSGGMYGGSSTPPPGPSDNWGHLSSSIAGEYSHGQDRGSPSLSEQFPVLRMPTPEFQEWIDAFDEVRPPLAL